MNEEPKKLTRNERIDRTQRLYSGALTLLREHEMISPQGTSEMKRAAWLKTARPLIEEMSPAWTSLLPEAPSRVSIVTAAESLLTLRDRIKNGRVETLTPEELRALTTRNTLFAFGDYLVDLTTGNSEPRPFADEDIEAFIAKLDEDLAIAAAVLAGSKRQASIEATIAFIRERVDASSFAYSNSAEPWHAGWAMITLSYLIGDALGDAVHIHDHHVPSFDQMARTRTDGIRFGSVRCPGCGVDIELEDEPPQARFVSQMWMCDSCELIGYYPKSAPSTSVWSTYVEEDEPLAEEEAVSDFAIPAAPDLAWMADIQLREIADTDFEEMNRCEAAEAPKAMLLMAGSACETMLLDVLQRNLPVTKAGLRRETDWPERVSLDAMIEVAEAEQLLTDSLGATATAVRKHRDLIHPNRLRGARIKVDIETARLLAQAARVVARDLESATTDGRIDRFVAKKLGDA